MDRKDQENDMNKGNNKFKKSYDIDEDKAYREYKEYKEYDKLRKNKDKRQRSYPSYVLVGLASALIGALIFALVIEGREKIYRSLNQPQNKITINAKDNYSIAEAVAEKTMASVVGITTKEVRESRDIFFGTTRQLVEGVGSGIIVSSDGYILTNSHVVADGRAQDIRALFIDGTEIEANLVWNDQSLDLAVIKVEANDLHVAELGNSDEVKIGEPAIAIGNPLGLEFERTVTSGIISGMNRTIAVSENSNMEGLIQTDASINSGNSGGPLLNKDGKVVGINTLKIQTGEGMGFSQPINIVKPIVEQIINTGTFEEAYLGIYAEDVLRYQKTTGKDFGVNFGSLIVQVEKDSPADKAGLKPGDIITSINGDNIETFQGLRKALYKFKPGESIKLGVVRDKQSKDIDVELEDTNKSDN